MSQLLAAYQRYHASGEINSTVEDKGAAIERVAAAHTGGKQDRLDGLTVEYGDWWFNVRPSNTEPLLRLNLEAPDDGSCKEHLSEVLALMKEEK